MITTPIESARAFAHRMTKGCASSGQFKAEDAHTSQCNDLTENIERRDSSMLSSVRNHLHGECDCPRDSQNPLNVEIKT